MNLVTLTVTLFLIMDAVGNVSSVLKLTENLNATRQRFVILREMVFALIAMLLFCFIGEWVFMFLKLSETSVMLSAGVILFLTALKIIFPADNSLRANLIQGEPFIVPLAIPLIAGPSLLATIMLFAHMEDSQVLMISAVLIAWTISLITLLFAPELKKVLRSNGLMAFERLLALILVMLAIQRVMDGVRLFVKTYG